MCDTMVVLGNSTEDGSVLFAKNSDRQPNEPHIMIRVPRMRHDLERDKYLKATYIQIPQVRETYEVVLLKPSWIWGCEMGWNEFGLNIGNEAVFTKEKQGEPSLIGMDMVRIALERCKTTEEAVEMIIELLGAYGQGGNCGYEKPFTYHNSFLIADQRSAWVLETAGIFWAAKKVKDVYAISNGLSIGNDMDRRHPDTVKHAIEKGWCKDEKEFSFAKCYSNKLFTHFSGAMERRKACETALRAAKGSINTRLLKTVLRAHHTELDGKLFRKKSLKSVCMHAGGVIGDHTTGSYIASINDNLRTYWVTGASTPCVSVFKPLWMTKDMPIFSEKEEQKAVDYWKLRERLHRHILQGDIDLSEYLNKRDHLEQFIDNTVTSAMAGDTAASERDDNIELPNKLTNRAGQSGGIEDFEETKQSEMMRLLFEKEEDFVRDQLAEYTQGSISSTGIKGGVYYRRYWRKQNKRIYG